MTTPQGEAVSTEAAPTPKDSLAARTNFSSGGRPWMILLKPTPRGRARIFEVVATQHQGLERYQEQTTKNGRDVAMVVITPKAPIPA